MSKSLISVVIPAYNEEAEIGKCLDSLLKQDLDKGLYEVIVVDNASTDSTAKIVKKYPFKLVFESKKSVVVARQTGVNKAKGTIIVSADADTVYPKHWLSRISKNFEKNPDIVGIVGWLYYKRTSFWFNVTNALSQKINQAIAVTTGKFPLVYAANFAMKKSALKKIGGYPSYIPELGDQQYILYKLQKIGKVIVDKNVYCTTSSRKHDGKVYKTVPYNAWYRLLGYPINKIFKKEVIGPAPAVRAIRLGKSHFRQIDS